MKTHPKKKYKKPRVTDSSDLMEYVENSYNKKKQ